MRYVHIFYILKMQIKNKYKPWVPNFVRKMCFNQWHLKSRWYGVNNTKFIWMLIIFFLLSYMSRTSFKIGISSDPHIFTPTPYLLFFPTYSFVLSSITLFLPFHYLLGRCHLPQQVYTWLVNHKICRICKSLRFGRFASFAKNS